MGEEELGAGAGGEAGPISGRVWVQGIARGLGSTPRVLWEGRGQTGTAAVAAGSNWLL